MIIFFIFYALNWIYSQYQQFFDRIFFGKSNLVQEQTKTMRKLNKTAHLRYQPLLSLAGNLNPNDFRGTKLHKNIPFISILLCRFGFSLFFTKSNKMKKIFVDISSLPKKNIQQNINLPFQQSKMFEYSKEREWEVETFEIQTKCCLQPANTYAYVIWVWSISYNDYLLSLFLSTCPYLHLMRISWLCAWPRRAVNPYICVCICQSSCTIYHNTYIETNYAVGMHCYLRGRNAFFSSV